MRVRDISQPRRDLLKVAGAATLLCALPVAFAQSKKPKIGVIGSGNVGSAIGRSWARAGYDVMFASRNLDSDKKLAAEVGAHARAGTPKEAGAFGEVLLFAVPYGALPDLGKSLGDSLKGKLVLDACNPFPQRDGDIANAAREKGAGVVSAELLPGAHIVRAFNAIGAARMGKAYEEAGRVGMPIAGDDKQAIEVASKLIRDLGYEPVLVGGLAMGKYLMPGTPLAGEHTPDEIRKIAATLKP
ncbi:MAG: NADPH-dependent F420 reductase [Gammaproteobacteria bacterium]